MSQSFALAGAGRAAATVKTPQQKIGGIAGVIAVHAVIVYALLTTLGVITLPKTVKDLTVVNVHDLPDEVELPRPPPPVIAAPPIETAIVPAVTLDYVPEQPSAITQPPAAPVPPGTQAPPLPAAPVFAPPVAIMATHTIPEYPPVSRRLGERGTARLALTVSHAGTVSEAEIVNSSGYPRLDAAAIAWIKAHWRYQPAREGAKPVAAKVQAVVEFRLR